MEKGSSAMLMVGYMMGIGNMELWMAMESCTILMRSLLMKVNGRITHFMEMDKFIMKIQCHLLIASIILILIIFKNTGRNMMANSKTISRKDSAHYTW